MRLPSRSRSAYILPSHEPMYTTPSAISGVPVTISPVVKFQAWVSEATLDAPICDSLELPEWVESCWYVVQLADEVTASAPITALSTLPPIVRKSASANNGYT